MNKPELSIGIDRYLAKQWVDYAYELRQSGITGIEGYVLLRSWLRKEISGKETARKTANHIKHIWLKDNDLSSDLRMDAISLGCSNPVLNYGMAINVFPFFRDLSWLAGRLIQLQGVFERKEIQKRMLEKYQSPATANRASDRCIQTLKDWGFLVEKDGKQAASIIEIDDPNIAGWFLSALVKNLPDQKMSYSDLIQAPLKLGISIKDERGIIRDHPKLSIERNGGNEEVVVYRSL
jgi:hypothetical protein